MTAGGVSPGSLEAAKDLHHVIGLFTKRWWIFHRAYLRSVSSDVKVSAWLTAIARIQYLNSRPVLRLRSERKAKKGLD